MSIHPHLAQLPTALMLLVMFEPLIAVAGVLRATIRLKDYTAVGLGMPDSHLYRACDDVFVLPSLH
ncbi:MAG: hypothetical protein ACI9HX_001481 [Pseudoalteromonas tetraodonis]|jgi:hypothetical protein